MFAHSMMPMLLLSVNMMLMSLNHLISPVMLLYMYVVGLLRINLCPVE